MALHEAWWVGHCIKNETPNAVQAITAGKGSGKTFGSCQWHHYRVLQNQKAQFSGFMEPTYGLIRAAAIPAYKKALGKFGYRQGEDYQVYWSPTPRIVYKRSKHEVLFWSGDNPESIEGFELSHASIDEAGAISLEATRNFRARVRDPLANICQTLIFGAPQGVTGFAEEFDSETLPGWELTHKRKHRHTEKPWWRYVLWTDDNPYIDPGYIDHLMYTYGHNPNLIKSYRYGLFCPLVEGAVYSNYLNSKHDIEDFEPDPHREIYLSLDFNANPMAWVSAQIIWVEGRRGREKKLVIIHEAEGKSNDLDDAIVEFQYLHPVHKYAHTPILIYGDMSGHAKSHKVKGRKTDYQVIADYLAELGYKNVEVKAAKVNPPETASAESVQRLFLRDDLLICQRLKNLKRSLMATTWKQGMRKIDKPSGKDTWTHWTDALKYLCFAIAWDPFAGYSEITGTNKG